MTGKRRIDRVTDPDLATRVPGLETSAVRALRDDCREEEVELSYLRRVLHARLDIARAEITRRGGDEQELLGRLPKILSERSSTPGEARSLRVYHPHEDGPRRREEDQILDEPALSRLPNLEDAEVEELITRLTVLERDISDRRATVLEHLDLLQDELVARYRDGRASIGEVLPSGSGT